MPEEKSKYYGNEITGPMAKAALTIVIKEGIYARRKLNGDPDVLWPNDETTLKAMAKRGLEVEKYCEEEGLQACIVSAKAIAGAEVESKPDLTDDEKLTKPSGRAKKGMTARKERSTCPGCGKEIDTLPFVERGAMTWDGKQWTRDATHGDVEYYCPECDCKLKYEELEKLGVF